MALKEASACGASGATLFSGVPDRRGVIPALHCQFCSLTATSAPSQTSLSDLHNFNFVLADLNYSGWTSS